MKKIYLIIIFLTLCWNTNSFATLDADTVWEVRTDGGSTNGAGFVWRSLVDTTYKWTLSASGANEYYCEAAAGGNPGLSGQSGMSVYTDGQHNLAIEGTVGSLTAGQWDWADNDTLGYNTVYVRLSDGIDPDLKPFGFVRMGKGGGTDYSQQVAAQLTLTDGATTGVGVTTFTSVTGGFTAAMAGNLIYISSGANATVGYYEITVYTNSNTVTLDRAPDDGVGGVSGANFKVGGAIDHPDRIDPSQVAGNTIYIKAGTYVKIGANTYVLNPTINGGNGTPVIWEGYNTTRGDEPKGTNRPLFDGDSDANSVADTANAITTGTSNNIVRNLRFFRVTADAGSGNFWYYNCLFDTAGDDGVSGRPRLIYCEISNNTDFGYDVSVANSGYILFCYSHDNGDDGFGTSNTGVGLEGEFSISDTNSGYGIMTQRFSDTGFLGCVAYNNTDIGFALLSNATATLMPIINNIAQDNNYGFYDNNTTGQSKVIFDFNISYSNTTQDYYGYLGNRGFDNNLTSDPLLTDPANGDFTLSSNSPALDTGLQPGTDIGLVGDYQWNIGVDQDDNAGGGTTGYASVF